MKTEKQDYIVNVLRLYLKANTYKEMAKLGRAVGASLALKGGHILVGVRGEVGAGKSTFARPLFLEASRLNGCSVKPPEYGSYFGRQYLKHQLSASDTIQHRVFDASALPYLKKFRTFKYIARHRDQGIDIAEHPGFLNEVDPEELPSEQGLNVAISKDDSVGYSYQPPRLLVMDFNLAVFDEQDLRDNLMPSIVDYFTGTPEVLNGVFEGARGEFIPQTPHP